MKEEDACSAAFHIYGTPKRGGQFDVDQETMSKFPFLYEFAETKVHGAYLLRALNSRLSCPVQPIAVANEIRIYERAVYIAPGMKWTSLSCKGRETECRPRREALVQFVAHNKHTLVTHPVGFHVDVFAKNKECFENKVCFRATGRQKCPMGRGGSGQNKYTFCVLDWANDPRNQKRRTFINSGFSKKRKMTKKNLAELHKQQPQLKW